MRVEIGADLPVWSLKGVNEQKLKTMAALLRDSNPIHFDGVAVSAASRGHRVIAQAPVTLGYLMNMLIAWCGSYERIAGVDIRFLEPVCAGDEVQAGGRVLDIRMDGDTRVVDCEVWLDVIGGSRTVAGLATVRIEG